MRGDHNLNRDVSVMLSSKKSGSNSFRLSKGRWGRMDGGRLLNLVDDVSEEGRTLPLFLAAFHLQRREVLLLHTSMLLPSNAPVAFSFLY